MHLILIKLAKLPFKGGLVFLFELGGRGGGFHGRLLGIYAIGAAISPAYAFVGDDGTLQRKKHTDLIYTAIRDGIQAMEDIAGRN